MGDERGDHICPRGNQKYRGGQSSDQPFTLLRMEKGRISAVLEHNVAAHA